MFRTVLVPLDRSLLAEQAIGEAVAIARAAHAELDIVLVHEPLPFAGFEDAPWSATQWNDELRYLESIVAEIESGGSLEPTFAVMRGPPAETICRRARDVEADLIVMTSHGRTGLSRAWLGSVADAVLRHATAPVLMLRPVEGTKAREAVHHLFKHVLVPLDGSALASDILTSVSALARPIGARVTLLRVVQPVPTVMIDAGLPYIYPPVILDDDATSRLVAEAKENIAEVAARLRGDNVLGVDAQVVVAPHVAQAIIDFANGFEMDLIAMSTHGRGASRLLMGSVADKVLRASDAPMLLHRPVGVGDAMQATNAHSPALARAHA